MAKELIYQNVKISHVMKLIREFQSLLKNVEPTGTSSLELERFLETMKPLSSLDLDGFGNIVRGAVPKKIKKIDPELEKLLNTTPPLVLLKSDHIKQLPREELSDLAVRHLGLSKSKLMKMRRSDMEMYIQSAIKNAETLDTIAKRASNDVD